jgi:hypothetical protein
MTPAELISNRNMIAEMALKDRLTFLFEGSSGIGKSDTMKQFAAALAKDLSVDVGFTTMYPALMTPADVAGYLTVGDLDGQRVAEYTLPPFVKRDDGKLLGSCKIEVLLVDEFDKADPDVKKTLSEMFLSRRLGSYFLPKNTIIFVCANAGARQGSTKMFDFLISRLVMEEWHLPQSQWVDWAWKNNVHPVVIQAAENPGNGKSIFEGHVPEKQGPWGTPRSYTEASKMLKTAMNHHEGKVPLTPFMQRLVAGKIGAPDAAHLFALLKLEEELPDFREIVKNPKGAKLPTRPDAQMLVTYNLAGRVDEESVGPVIEYIDRMAQEWVVAFVKAATTKDKTIMSTSAFSKWIIKNQNIMSIVAAA